MRQRTETVFREAKRESPGTKLMTKAILYTRSTTGDHDQQRDEIIAKYGETHEIIAEYRDDGTTASVSKLLEESGAEILLCADITRLGRQFTPESMAALQASGVKLVTVAEGEIGVADFIAQAMMGHTARTVVGEMSQRVGSRKRPMPKT